MHLSIILQQRIATREEGILSSRILSSRSFSVSSIPLLLEAQSLRLGNVRWSRHIVVSPTRSRVVANGKDGNPSDRVLDKKNAQSCDSRLELSVEIGALNRDQDLGNRPKIGNF